MNHGNSPLQLQRIDHTVLRVRDLERSVRFYTEVLGCGIDRRRDDLGLVHLRAGASLIDLVAVTGPLGRRDGGCEPVAVARNMDHLCLKCEPFTEEELLAHLDAHGVKHDAKAQVNYGAEGDGLSLYLSDPDENLIELKCYGMQRNPAAG